VSTARMTLLLTAAMALTPFGCGSDEEAALADALSSTTATDEAGDGDAGTDQTSTDGGDTTADGGDDTTGTTTSTSGGETTGTTTSGNTTTGGGTDGGGSTGADVGGDDWSDVPVDVLDDLCLKTVKIQLEAEDATLKGWDITESSFEGEGNVIFADNVNDATATATFEVDVPCADDFTVWIRGRDNGQSDSHFVAVDGQPNPPLIHEVDCTGDGDDYKWTKLNQRALNAGPCEYVTNPWIQTWDPGKHRIVFTPREEGAVSRLVITNDPNWDPESIE
jgi:hypothetical protein